MANSIRFTAYPKESDQIASRCSVGSRKEARSLAVLHKFIQVHPWSPSVFKDNRRKIGSFEFASAAGLDFDGGISVEEALARLRERDWNYSITYSRNHLKVKNKGTSSEKSACDRFRLVLTFSRPITDAASFLATMNELEKVFPEMDKQCKDPARFFFASSGGPSDLIYTCGKNIDPIETNLNYEEVKKGPKKQKERSSRKVNTEIDQILKPHTNWFLNNAATSAAESTFNEDLNKASYELARCGISEKDALKLITKAAPEPLDQVDLRTFSSGYKAGQKEGHYKKLQNEKRNWYEQAVELLGEAFAEAYILIEDAKGVCTTLQRKGNNTVREVAQERIIREATKSFNIQGIQVAPRLVRDAVNHVLNLQEIYRNQVSSIALKNEPGLAYNRLDFTPVKGNAPLFTELLNRSSNSDALCAFIWSLFIPKANRQQYVWIYGEGGNGKSSLGRFLDRLLGDAYCSERAAGATQNKHYTAAFIGRRLAVYTDTNSVNFIKSELFKELTGNDPIKIERKHQAPFTTKIDTKFMFMSNSIPRISSQKADLRRIILCRVLPFQGDPDPNYDENLWGERAVILKICEEKYELLTQNNGPIECDIVDASEVAQDTEVAFEYIFDLCLYLNRKSKVAAKDLYGKIKGPCKESGVKYQDFLAWLERIHGITQKRRKEDGDSRYYYGIALRETFPMVVKDDF